MICDLFRKLRDQPENHIDIVAYLVHKSLYDQNKAVCKLIRIFKQLPQVRSRLTYSQCQTSDRIHHGGQHIFGCCHARINEIVYQAVKISRRVCKTYKQILPCCLYCSGRTLYSFGGFLCGSPCEAYMLLHFMNGSDHIGKVFNGKVCGFSVRLSPRVHIVNKPLHLFLCAAVPQLEIVQHGVVLLCEALISILYRLYRCAHLVCVVGHINDSLISDPCRFFSVAAEGVYKGSRKGCDLLHVLVGGYTRRAECFLCVFPDRGLCPGKKGLDTAHELFIFTIGIRRFLNERHSTLKSGLQYIHRSRSKSLHSIRFKYLLKDVYVLCAFLHAFIKLIVGFAGVCEFIGVFFYLCLCAFYLSAVGSVFGCAQVTIGQCFICSFFHRKELCHFFLQLCHLFTEYLISLGAEFCIAGVAFKVFVNGLQLTAQRLDILFDLGCVKSYLGTVIISHSSVSFLSLH